jgi:hypothetical protein
MGVRTEQHQDGQGNHEQSTNNDPEDAKGVQVTFQTGLGDGTDGVANAAAACEAGDGIWLQLGSTASAEHGNFLPRYGLAYGKGRRKFPAVWTDSGSRHAGSRRLEDIHVQVDRLYPIGSSGT